MNSNTATLIVVMSSMATVFTAVTGLLVAIFKRGRSEGITDGRLTEILSNLQTLANDHETRIRVLESHRSP